jgi:SAM-dependent methyltransferase
MLGDSGRAMKPLRFSEPESHPLSEREVAHAWDRNADSWAEQVRKGWDIYREVYNNPAFLEFIGASIGDLAGKSVLDAGCGEGYNTRILARRGAKMTGADISARMIELARQEEHSEPLGVRYEVNSFSDLSIFAEASFDAAVSFMALMDGPDFPGATRAIGRVLRPGGTLVFSITHPCFMTKGFNWIRDESEKETALTVARYFDDESWIERWKFNKAPEPQAAEPFAVPRFDRTLSFYLNTLIESGFALGRIGEPRPSEEACRVHPFLRRWREHAPLFFYVSAQKPR